MLCTIEAVDIDLYGDESLLNPYHNYSVIRDSGPVVYLENLGLYAAGRYDVVREILARSDVFISGNRACAVSSGHDCVEACRFARGRA